MVSKTKLGLAGLILGTSIACSPQKNITSNYIDGTLHGTEYSDYKGNENYSLEGQVLFSTGNKKLDKAYFFGENKEWNTGELNFSVYDAEKTKVISSYDGNKTELKGKKYIPTRLGHENETLKEFKLNNIEAKLGKKLIKKSKELSENSFGYSYLINDKDFKKILPQITINGETYLYFDRKKGKFTSNEKPLHIDGKIPEIFVPVETAKFGINPTNGDLTIYGEFYQPTPESRQENPKKKEYKNLENNTNENTKDTYQYEVRNKDTGWSIAEEHCGSGKAFDKLKEENPQIKDWTKIRPGQKINIPCDCE